MKQPPHESATPTPPQRVLAGHRVPLARVCETIKKNETVPTQSRRVPIKMKCTPQLLLLDKASSTAIWRVDVDAKTVFHTQLVDGYCCTASLERRVQPVAFDGLNAASFNRTRRLSCSTTSKRTHATSAKALQMTLLFLHSCPNEPQKHARFDTHTPSAQIHPHRLNSKPCTE